jgi:hypothetical protein
MVSEPDRAINLKVLPKGIYQLYISDDHNYWFNTPYIDYRSGILVNKISYPVAIIYNFSD